jgi:hypothetical protein
VAALAKRYHLKSKVKCARGAMRNAWQRISKRSSKMIQYRSVDIPQGLNHQSFAPFSAVGVKIPDLPVMP